MVEDVAREAGVSKGTIYTYFDRKEELLGAVAQGFMDELTGREEAILESHRPPLEKIRAMLHEFVDLVSSREGFATVMLDIWGIGMRDPDRFGIDVAALYAEYRALLQTLLREAQARGTVPADLSIVAPTALIGAIEGVLLQWLLDPDAVDFPEGADDVIDLLYDGIRSEEAS